MYICQYVWSLGHRHNSSWSCLGIYNKCCKFVRRNARWKFLFVNINSRILNYGKISHQSDFQVIYFEEKKTVAHILLWFRKWTKITYLFPCRAYTCTISISMGTDADHIHPPVSGPVRTELFQDQTDFLWWTTHSHRLNTPTGQADSVLIPADHRDSRQKLYQ